MHKHAARLSRTVFVVFSDDWGRHPSSCQHLFRRILPHAEVLWVNTVGLRTPRLSLYDVRRAFQVIAGWLSPRKPAAASARAASQAAAPVAGAGTAPDAASDAGPSPRVLRPLMWPSFSRPWCAALNQRLLSRAVAKALDGLAPGREPVLVSTLPLVPGLFRDGRFRRKVYYCVDDFTEWHGIDGEAMRRLERETLAACDLLVATSTPLLEDRGPRAPAAVLLTHGVDAEHFAGAAPDPRSPLASLPHPVVGMFGVFDRRVDGALLRAAARALPQATFAVLGPVVDREPGEFADVPNLRFFGKVPYAELPGHVAHFDACILPYVLDRTTLNINPLKLKEYLATGKPVVATPLPEAGRLGAHLELAGPERFAEALAAALARPAPRPGLAAFLREESWDAKAARFADAILGEP